MTKGESFRLYLYNQDVEMSSPCALVMSTVTVNNNIITVHTICNFFPIAISVMG